MRFSILLFILAQVLKIASLAHPRFRRFIRPMSARILIKTQDGRHARLFILDKGHVSSKAGDHDQYNAALVWKDARTGFSVMTSKKSDASFNAAAEGRLKVLGMNVYAQWFQEAVQLLI